MENLGAGKFSAKIARLERTLRYRVATGAFTSATFTAEAVDHAGNRQCPINALSARLHRPRLDRGAEGSIEGLKGSTAAPRRGRRRKMSSKPRSSWTTARKSRSRSTAASCKRVWCCSSPSPIEFWSKTSHGFKNSPISYELRVKPDGFPTVDLLRPTEDLEINGDEVLNLEYSARDDFGIGEINLIVKIGEREDKIRLARGRFKRLILRDQYKWDLGRLGCATKTKRCFSCKCSTTTPSPGRRLGTSKSVRLKLKNLKGEHQQIAEMVKRLEQRA